MEEKIKTYEDGINFINGSFPPLTSEEQELAESGDTPTDISIPLLRRSLVNAKLITEFDSCIKEGLPVLDAFYKAFHTSRLYIEELEENFNK
jgi:hypothetical protein